MSDKNQKSFITETTETTRPQKKRFCVFVKSRTALLGGLVVSVVSVIKLF
jgi:hypothetical protein